MNRPGGFSFLGKYFWKQQLVFRIDNACPGEVLRKHLEVKSEKQVCPQTCIPMAEQGTPQKKRGSKIMANREVLNSGDKLTAVGVFSKNTENGLKYHFSFVFLRSSLTSYRQERNIFSIFP